MAENFEKSMTELEETVSKLERGDVSLEEALNLFEKGIKLSKTCQKILDDAEKRVSILISDENGNMQAQDFPELD